jgi:hypothetical protein
MKLADRIAQCRAPFVVTCGPTGGTRILNNAAECAHAVSGAPIRFVLSDELTRLCTALAYSKGSRTLACADLIRIPAQAVWIEWFCRPWQDELSLHAISVDDPAYSPSHRRGAFDPAHGAADIIRRCFRFHYEASWREYYRDADLDPDQRGALWRHALGTIALDVPVLLAFFLLLSTRAGLPQSPRSFERLNRSRLKAGKAPLLAHVDVRAPLLPDYRAQDSGETAYGRRGPRLHHVRGHLVRRGAELFWRVPHLRGDARLGAVRTRTVTWTFGGH